jgi:hypothetical protein
MLSDVAMLGNVCELDISFCRKIQDISSLGNVSILLIRHCSNIIQGLPSSSTIKCLTFSSIHVQFVSDLQNDVNSKKLTFYSDSEGEDTVQDLKSLDIMGFTDIYLFYLISKDTNITELSHLYNIRSFYLYNMKSLKNLLNFLH